MGHPGPRAVAARRKTTAVAHRERSGAHAILPAMTALRMRRAAFFPLVALLFFLLGTLVPPSALAPVWAAPATVTTPAAASAASPASEASPAPSVKAKAAIVMDMEDGRVIFARNADERRPMASTTKMMTGILALERLPMDKVVAASKKATDAGESEIYLVPGEKLTVEELLYAVLVKSANDAAATLAEATAGSQEAFVELMNQKAQELGMTNTHFDNPHGLDSDQHYSTATDLATLARYAMKNPEFRRYVATEEASIPWPGRAYGRTLTNHNTLLGVVPYVNGVKTGYTRPAGFCLVGSGSKGGVSLISVVLGEQNKDGVNSDTKKLLDWGFSRYREVVLVEKGTPLASLEVPYHLDTKLPLVADRRLVRTVYVDDAVTPKVHSPASLALPVEQGAVLGKVRFVAGTKGQALGEVNLVALRTVESPSLGVKVRYFWDRFLRWVEGVL